MDDPSGELRSMRRSSSGLGNELFNNREDMTPRNNEADRAVLDLLKSSGYLFPETDEQMAAYEATVKLREMPEKFRTPEFVFKTMRENKNQQLTMDITKMTAAQRAELKAQLEAEERAEKQKREEDVAAYKSAVDEFCRLKFSRLKAMSEEMRRLKDEVFAEAETLIKLKEELFKTKSDRHSDQFTTSDGRITLALGNRTNDGWDDTVEVGVAKVKEFIRSLAKDDDSAALTEMVMSLLAKDRKGNLKASRVLQLREIARKSGYPALIEATDIIQGAYRPEETCQFISASWKDERGVKHTLPLSMAAMD